jgi:hypothetical protein
MLAGFRIATCWLQDWNQRASLSSLQVSVLTVLGCAAAVQQDGAARQWLVSVGGSIQRWRLNF